VAGNALKILMGAEWAFNDLLAVRAGINEREIAAGLGLKFKDWGLDYTFAYQDAVAGLGDLGASHRVGLHFGFGKKISEQAADLRWQRKGQDVLNQLRACVSGQTVCSDEDVQKLSGAAKQVIRRQGFVRAEDLYTAQGYVAYLNHEYQRSVQSLTEASALAPQSSELTDAIQKVRAEMTEESSRELIAIELKRITESYAKGDFRTTVKSCEKVLSFQPGNIEALTYLQDAKNRLNEPIEREMKIASMKMERGEYLGAVKSLQRVQELDPDNAQAAQMIGQAISALEKQAAIQSESSAANKTVYEVQQINEQSRDLYSKGLVLYSQGKIKEAARIWEQAVRVDSDNTLARSAFNRAQIEMNEKP
jgi:tetratricopeptide (TPR) repeat protein